MKLFVLVFQGASQKTRPKSKYWDRKTFFQLRILGIGTGIKTQTDQRSRIFCWHRPNNVSFGPNFTLFVLDPRDPEEESGELVRKLF
jgi:hypothetical protein